MDFEILHERPEDAPLIDPLLDRTFGPMRRMKTVYRLREGIDPVPGLSFVATGEAGNMLASIRYWPILIAGEAAILLGPLAVEPAQQGRGLGRTLVAHSLREARRLGHRICVVVGDPGYYRPYGFAPAATYGLILPGPVEPPRFQVLELKPGALEGVHGVIARDERSQQPVRRGRAARGAA